MLAAPYPSNRLRILDASREKYAISAGDSKRHIEEEESTIIRSAQEKAAISHVARKDGEAPTAASAPQVEETAEPLI